jgi:hypothetical protein
MLLEELTKVRLNCIIATLILETLKQEGKGVYRLSGCAI